MSDRTHFFVVAFWITVIAVAAAVYAAPRQVAPAWVQAHAQLLISTDGNTVTVRAAAPDSLRLCIEPRESEALVTRCFTVGSIRRGARP